MGLREAARPSRVGEDGRRHRSSTGHLVGPKSARLNARAPVMGATRPVPYRASWEVNETCLATRGPEQRPRENASGSGKIQHGAGSHPVSKVILHPKGSMDRPPTRTENRPAAHHCRSRHDQMTPHLNASHQRRTYSRRCPEVPQGETKDAALGGTFGPGGARRHGGGLLLGPACC